MNILTNGSDLRIERFRESYYTDHYIRTCIIVKQLNSKFY